MPYVDVIPIGKVKIYEGDELVGTAETGDFGSYWHGCACGMGRTGKSMLQKMLKEIDTSEKFITETRRTIRDLKINGHDYEHLTVADKELSAARIHLLDARKAIKVLWEMFR